MKSAHPPLRPPLSYVPKKPKKLTPPEKIETPQERGEAFQVWLNQQNIKVKDFAINANISRSQIHNYINGTTDLAMMESGTADVFLRAMGIADMDAWRILGIPPERQRVFRSFRPYPLGHGPHIDHADDDLLSMTLDQPLYGTLNLAAGIRCQLNTSPEGKLLPYQIYRLADGRYYSANPTQPPVAKGITWLGGLETVDFSGR